MHSLKVRSIIPKVQLAGDTTYIIVLYFLSKLAFIGFEIKAFVTRGYCHYIYLKLFIVLLYLNQ